MSTSKPQTPYGPAPLHSSDMRVSELLRPENNEWDLPAIKSIVPQYEDQIRELVPSCYKKEDKLIWLLTKSGDYSAKTGYALLSQNQSMKEGDFNWISSVWQVQTSPKLRHFLWKTAIKALSTGTRLIERGIAAPGSCKGCGEPETDLHIFLHFPYAKTVWDLIPVSNASAESIYFSKGDPNQGQVLKQSPTYRSTVSSVSMGLVILMVSTK